MKTRYLCLALFLSSITLLPMAWGANSCRDLFRSKQPIKISREILLKDKGLYKDFLSEHMTESKIELNSNGEIKRFNDEDVSRIEDAKGVVNFGIYTVRGSDPPRIIKLYRKRVLPGKSFERVVLGNLAASLVGGPLIYGFGIVKRTDGLVFEYIEMERLFASWSKPFTVKNDFNMFDNFMNLLSINKIADLIYKALVSRVLVYDLDIAFDTLGNYRWIDGDFWELSSNYSNLNSYLPHIILNKNRKSELLRLLQNKIQSSSKLLTEEKEELLSQFPSE